MRTTKIESDWPDLHLVWRGGENIIHSFSYLPPDPFSKLKHHRGGQPLFYLKHTHLICKSSILKLVGVVLQHPREDVFMSAVLWDWGQMTPWRAEEGDGEQDIMIFSPGYSTVILLIWSSGYSTVTLQQHSSFERMMCKHAYSTEVLWT